MMDRISFLGLAIILMSAQASSSTPVYHDHPVEEAHLQSKQTYRFRSLLECALECEKRSDCSFFSYFKTSESCTLEERFNPLWLTGSGVRDIDDRFIVYMKPEDIPAIRNDLARGECWLTNSSQY